MTQLKISIILILFLFFLILTVQMCSDFDLNATGWITFLKTKSNQFCKRLIKKEQALFSPVLISHLQLGKVLPVNSNLIVCLLFVVCNIGSGASGTSSVT